MRVLRGGRRANGTRLSRLPCRAMKNRKAEMHAMRLEALIVLAAVGICARGLPLPEASAQEIPTRVIFIIGDGAGAGYWTAAAVAADHLAVERLPVGGLVDTRNSDNKVTDSAASGTAYSAGVRTYNGAIGVDPDGQVVTTVLEVAQRRGLATGLVATSSITHATPAAFASHVPNRYMEWEIARQLADAGVDVMLGGGRRWFDPAQRPDSLDLLSDLNAGYTFVRTPSELDALRTETVRRLVGLFAEDYLPAAPERSPTLPAMTRAALQVLDHDPDGFFLMVEGSQPDWRGHDGDPLAAIAAEMLDLDEAVEVALEYQARNPETLIVVTADHETGGLAVQQVQLLADSSVLVARYTTENHTANMVPLFASGPGAERFGGIKENWRVGELLREAVSR